jgi:hypothetical protein
MNQYCQHLLKKYKNLINLEEIVTEEISNIKISQM